MSSGPFPCPGRLLNKERRIPDIKTWKKFASVSLAAALGTVLWSAPALAEDTADAPVDLTFCLDWTPNTNHTGLYTAQALGYYEEAGLNVSIVQPPENGATLMCASGQAQFAIEAQDTLASALDSGNDLGVTTVAALLQHNTSGIISRAGEGMDTPAGLEGKTYSTWETPTELAIMEQVVTEAGGDFSKVTLIPNDITDEPGALAAHQTDAIWIFYGWGGINAELSGLDFDYWNFANLNPVFDYYTPVLIANKEFLEESPDTARAFLAATAKGYQYAIEHPREAADLLIAGDTTGSLQGSEELVYTSQEWLSKQYLAEEDRWGYIDPARWDGFYTWLYENGLTSNDLTGTGYTNDYLPE